MPGATVHGSVTFETSTPDAHPDARVGQYWDALLDARLSLGGVDLRMGTPSLESANGIPTSAFPLIARPVSGRDTMITLAEDLGLTYDALLGLMLSSRDPIRFDPDFLDPDPPELGTLDPFGYDDTSASGWGTNLFLALQTDIGRAIVISSISRLERVPEPGAVTLVALSLAALAGLGRRSS